MNNKYSNKGEWVFNNRGQTYKTRKILLMLRPRLSCMMNVPSEADWFPVGRRGSAGGTSQGGEIDELLKTLPLPEFNLLSRRRMSQVARQRSDTPQTTPFELWFWFFLVWKIRKSYKILKHLLPFPMWKICSSTDSTKISNVGVQPWSSSATDHFYLVSLSIIRSPRRPPEALKRSLRDLARRIPLEIHFAFPSY